MVPHSVPAESGATNIWSEPSSTWAFLKGRVALHAILRAAGIGDGDEVLIPGFTCVVVPAAVLYTGASPVFYDVSRQTMNGSLQDATRRITRRTRAILIQHTFGSISDPSPFLLLAREHGCLVIEDCAHAMGAKFQDAHAGQFGDAAFTSLQWSKTVSCGLGGIARVNEPELKRRLVQQYDEYSEPSLAQQVQLMTLHGIRQVLRDPRLFWASQTIYRKAGSIGLVPGSSTTSELLDTTEPASYRLRFGRVRTPLLSSALRNLDDVIAHRREIAGLYARLLSEFEAVMQETAPAASSAHVRFPTLVENRDEILELAKRQSVELGDWFDAPLHPGSANPAKFGYQHGSCPNAEWLSARIVNLPTHSGISVESAREIAGFIKRFARLTMQANNPHQQDHNTSASFAPRD